MVNSSQDNAASGEKVSGVAAADPSPTPQGGQRPDMRGGLRTFLGLDIAARLFIWSTAFALAIAALSALGVWPEHGPIGAGLRQAWQWGQCLCGWIVLFNLIYVLELVVLRLPIPTPKEGRYATTTLRPHRQIVWSCLLALLTKARYEAPFPGFLVFHFANLPPLCWLVEPVFGPRTRSCNATDALILDPHLVTLGRNVAIGLNTTMLGHYQERDCVVFARTLVEDDVLIGGDCVVFGGVRIQRGAMIGAGAVVLPGTVVGPNEFWAGVPARKIRDLPSVDEVIPA